MSHKTSIKLTTLDLHNIYYSISAIEGANKTIPFKLVWKLNTVKDEVKTRAERYEKKRFEIYSKFGEPDSKDPNRISLKTEVIPDVNKELEELNNIEETIEINLIPISLFESSEALQLPPGIFEILKKYIIDFEN